jgi:hypothetical protein
MAGAAGEKSQGTSPEIQVEGMLATLGFFRKSSFQHPFFFFREQPVDLVGEFEKLYRVLLTRRPFRGLDPGFSGFALHVKIIL